MTTFRYTFLSRFIYRYSNFIATFLLLLHALVSFTALWIDWINIFPLIINLIIIYILNRYFYRIYKYFPFKIEIDNEKIICSDFFWKKEVIEIELKQIDNITGGVFSKNTTSPIYIEQKTKNIKIGILLHLKGFNKLLTIILSNINNELYHRLLDSIKANQQLSIFKNKKAPKKQGSL